MGKKFFTPLIRQPKCIRDQTQKDHYCIFYGTYKSDYILQQWNLEEKRLTSIGSYPSMLMQLAAEVGATRVVKTAQETFYGGYAGYFQDPDRHLWEIIYNPAFLPTT
jgi:hypothetical protein